MKTAESKTVTPSFQRKTEASFFGKGEDVFFDGNIKKQKGSFFDYGKSSNSVQAKLTVGRPDDAYELEADSMANKVVQRLSMQESGQTANNSIQAKFQEPVTTGKLQPKCSDCEKKEKEKKNGEDIGKEKRPQLQKKTNVEAIKNEPAQIKENLSGKIGALGQKEFVSRSEKSASNTITAISPSIQPKCASCEKEERLEKEEEEVENEKRKLHRKPIFESNSDPPEEGETVWRYCKECDEGDKILKKGIPKIQMSSFDQQPSPNGSRESIVAGAKGELGKVQARLDDGSGRRVGAERLLEYFHVAAPGVWDDGSIERTEQKMPSWCGIFSVWALKKAGKDVGNWRMGKGISGLGTLNQTDNPVPGDVGYIDQPYQHHAIVSGIEGDKIMSVDGNSGMNSEVKENSKPKSGYSGFFTAFGSSSNEATVQTKLKVGEEALQRHSSSDADVSASTETKLSGNGGSGQPLPDNTLHQMEGSFGADFSKVRIHTDASSAEMNKELSAQAFTHENNIYFNAGKFRPGESEGNRLLAHELTHVIQQGYAGENSPKEKNQEPSGSIQRDSDPKEDKLEKERKSWDKSHNEFKKLKKYHDAAYSLRVLFLLNSKSSSQFKDIDEVDLFIDDCEYDALDEEVTISKLPAGWEAFYLKTSPDAFPVKWSKKVYEALFLDVDTKAIEEEIKKAWKNVEEKGDLVPAGILDKGLPIPFKDAFKLVKYDFSFALVTSTADSAVVDLALAGRNFIALKWVNTFYAIWNKIAEAVRDRIADGSLVVNPASYEEYVEKKKESVQALSKHIASATDELTLENINKEAKDLRQVALLMGLGSTLAGIVVAMTFWKEVRKVFEKKMEETDAMIQGQDKYQKIALAIKWGYENGYFGAAGIQLWNAIKDNWKEMLATMAAFIIVQFIPYLNVAVDVIVVLHSGIDALKTLASLVKAFSNAAKVNSVISMQREAAKLSQSITADGVKLIIDIIGIVAGIKGVKTRVSSLKSANPAMSEQEALNKAIKEQGLSKELEQTVKGTLKVEESTEMVRKLGGMNAETIENLSRNPKLKNALFENNRAASILKRCASPCYPPNALPEQVERLERLLKLAEDSGIPMDKEKVREFLYNRRDGLDDAMNTLEEFMAKKEFNKAWGKEPEPDMRFESPQGTKAIRGQAGVPTGTRELPKLNRTWLDNGISQIPGQIAVKLKNMVFRSWDDFRSTFWRLVSQDEELSASPYLTAKQNPNLISLGKAPFTKSKEAVGKGVNAKYQIDHGTPINIGGETYNLDELYIVTPRIHEAIGK